MKPHTLAEIVETVIICCWLLSPLVLVLISEIRNQPRPRRSRGSVTR